MTTARLENGDKEARKEGTSRTPNQRNIKEKNPHPSYASVDAQERLGASTTELNPQKNELDNKRDPRREKKGRKNLQ